MDLISIALLAISLSMDAFAVSIGNGITIRKLRPWHAIKTGLFFGLFQALMPTIGWLAGRSISTYIVDYDHWIAFGLLAIIGGKMIWDGFHEEEEDCEHEDPTRTRWLFLLAIATSIDAVSYTHLSSSEAKAVLWYSSFSWAIKTEKTSYFRRVLLVSI